MIPEAGLQVEVECQGCHESARVRNQLAARRWLDAHWPVCPIKLDCFYCDISGFTDFASLAAHVQAEHWGRINPNYEKGEFDQMPLPKPEGTAYSDFLKASHFGGKEEGSVEVTGVREATKDSFSDVFVDVLLGKRKFTWGLKADSRNYMILHARFGDNEKKWKGTVNVVLVTKGKNTYINAVDEEE